MSTPAIVAARINENRSTVRGGLRNDDETLLVLQREEESLLFMLGEVASSNTLGRLLRSPEKG
jgi:hypothetical protein